MTFGLLETRREWYLLAVSSLIILFVYSFYWRTRSYFIDRNVKFIRGWPFIGVFHKLFRGKAAVSDLFEDIYKVYPNEPVVGFFDLGGKPMYLLQDPELIKQVTIKDFDHFVDHITNLDVEIDQLFGRSLFFMTGKKWKDMRGILSPAFTGSKMRLMYSLMIDSTQRFIEKLKSDESFLNKEVNMKNLFRKYAAVIISTCAFGLEMESFPDGGAEFLKVGQSITDFDGQLLKFFGYSTFPKIMKFLRVQLVNDNDSSFFRNLVMSMVQHREKNSIKRPDMINLLMEIRKGADIKSKEDEFSNLDAGFATVKEYSSKTGVSPNYDWTDNDLVAQCMLFFIAGFDTVSTALSFLIYELAMNPEIQDRLYEEIVTVKNTLNSKQLSYEQLNHLIYLDNVISETLRRWSPVPTLSRRATKQYKLNIGNGRMVLIEPGDGVWIPSYAMQTDSTYFPNPKKFDPDRFNEDNKNNIPPGAYIPFGIGPRNCIGSRFALTELKCLVYYLLQEFRVETCARTPIPLKFKRNSGSIDAEGGIWLQFKQRNVQ